MELLKATPEHKEAIKNLMQFYMYDFSRFIPLDVEDDGLFAPYLHFDSYWQEEGSRFAYIIIKDEKYAGFVLVRHIEAKAHNYFSVAEFFVMKKYRREGIGTAVAKQLFNLHKGLWEVYQKESNKPAQIFWYKVIDEYTNAKFTERFEDGKSIQSFVS
ncbi:MAG: GNAT family N-acetyltransferase [Ferruginibacter sp.]